MAASPTGKYSTKRVYPDCRKEWDGYPDGEMGDRGCVFIPPKFGICPVLKYPSIGKYLGAQLRDEKFIDHLIALIKGSGVNPNKLELEITETGLFENIEQTLSILKK